MMILEQALEARATAIREGYIDTEAIERLNELLPGDDTRHPFHSMYMLGKKLAEQRNEIVMRCLQ